MDKIEKIKDYLSELFPYTHVEVDYGVDISSAQDEINYLYDLVGDDNLITKVRDSNYYMCKIYTDNDYISCINFSIYKMMIFINNINKCTNKNTNKDTNISYSGSVIIDKIKEFARKLGDIQYIMIDDDQSYIVFSNEDTRHDLLSISLKDLSLYTYGETFYNRKGFIDLFNGEENKEKWNEYINRKLSDVVPVRYFRNILEMLSYNSSIYSITIKDFFRLCLDKIKEMTLKYNLDTFNYVLPEYKYYLEDFLESLKVLMTEMNKNRPHISKNMYYKIIR